MSVVLSAPLASYFAAKNAFDVDGMLACFAQTAAVRDEGEDRIGLAVIRDWIENTTRKYRVSVRPTNVAQDDDATVVTAQVSGNFPGSPVELRYRFTVADGKIARLSIS